MRALCRETRLKQIGCVHTIDTCEELCMYIHVLSFILSRTFFSSSSSFISLPVGFRSSLFRARAKKKNERNIVLIPVNTHRSKEEEKKNERRILFLFSVSSVLIQVRTCSFEIND